MATPPPPPPPEPTPAPDFALRDGQNEEVTKDSFRGRWLVLYFYPRDNTAGCTTEAQQFSALAEEFAAASAAVVGVSPDSVASHQRFQAKHGLRLTLLSDPQHATCARYGAWGIKKHYGKEAAGVIRSTVLVDPHGSIRRTWTKVKADGHAAAVLAALRELQAS